MLCLKTNLPQHRSTVLTVQVTYRYLSLQVQYRTNNVLTPREVLSVQIAALLLSLSVEVTHEVRIYTFFKYDTSISEI